MLPAEFNLSPLFRQRLDENGKVLELDILWPLIHYEVTADGGSDFRIRPFYRRVEKGDLVPNARATDHQFLWPLGRVRCNPDETSARLWPLWQQAFIVTALLLNDRVIALWIRGLLGQNVGGWEFWVSPMVSGLLWPWVYSMLNALQTRSRHG